MALFNAGQPVRRKSSPDNLGMVSEIGVNNGGVQYYKVLFDGRLTTMSEVDLVATEQSAGLKSELVSGPLGGIDEFRRLLTFQRLRRDHPLQNHIYAFNASRTRFYPHQFKPLIKFLESDGHRILIADEVGLGKTIEAGLILTELEARSDVERALVVCPANLTLKWQMELKNRFGQSFQILKLKDYMAYLEEYAKNPAGSELRGIISIESIRARRSISAMEQVRPSFDFVVVDEAHHMRNFGRQQRKAGQLLSECTEAMVLMSATPIQLGDQDLYSLCNLLNDEEFPDKEMFRFMLRHNEPLVKAQRLITQGSDAAEDVLSLVREAAEYQPALRKMPEFDPLIDDLGRLTDSSDTKGLQRTVDSQRRLARLNLLGHVITRTRKRDVDVNRVERHPYPWKVVFTEPEKAFYAAVTDFVRAESRRQTDMPAIQQWIVNTPQRRVASSIPAMVEYYRSRVQEDLGELSEDVPFFEEDRQAENDLQSARERLESVIKDWPDDGPDSKYDEFKRILDTVREKRGALKVLVFAFFKDTLRYLQYRLAQDGVQALLISGDVPPAERVEIIDRFKDNPNIEVMLSSKVGSEGLDFQFCDSLVNYDLPWNPMEIEQRIGRIDRLGQESPVIDIHNLCVEDTIEERILERLFNRIGVFENCLGDIEQILGEEWRELERALLTTDLTSEEQNRRIDATQRVIKQRQQELEELDRDRARFIGTDEYFQNEVENIRNRYRFVTEKQLYDYLVTFLERKSPRTRLTYDLEKGKGRLWPDQELLTFITSQEESGALSHYYNLVRKGVEVTFNREVAFDDPRIEFFNVTHPLVQAVTRYWEEHLDGFNRCHHVRVGTSEIPPGFYLYFIWRCRVSGAQEHNSLELVVLDPEMQEISPSGGIERLLGQILEDGSRVEEALSERDPGLIEAAFDIAEQLYLDRCEAIRRERDSTNAGYLERRRMSLKNYFGKRIQGLEEQLDKAARDGGKESYIRMTEGRRVKAQQVLTAKLEELESKRTIGVEHVEVAAGILEVEGCEPRVGA